MVPAYGSGVARKHPGASPFASAAYGSRTLSGGA